MTTTAIRPHHQALAAARLVANLRTRYPQTQTNWQQHVADLDGYPTTASGSDRTRTTGTTTTRNEHGDIDTVTLTSVEGTAAAREHWTNQYQAVHRWTAIILTTRNDIYTTVTTVARHQMIPVTHTNDPLETVAWTLPRLTLMALDQADIEAGITLIATAAHEALHACDNLTLKPHHPGTQCSGGIGRDGALITYTPRSTNPDNGWADPTCQDLTGDHPPLCDACHMRESRWRRRHNLPNRQPDNA